MVRRMWLSERVRREEPLRGVLCVIPSSVVAQAVAAAGADFLVVDREHGPIGRETLHAMVAATAGTQCAPLVRVPAIDAAEVKLALDAGAEGVMFPLLRSADDARRCVELTRYPPGGRRGWGPMVAHARHGVALADYAATVGPRIACMVMIETAEAVAAIDEILAVEGIDLAFVAPFDLGAALGVAGRPDAPELAAAMGRIEDAAGARGVPLGTVAFDPEAACARTAAGHRLLLCGIDVLMLSAQVAAHRSWG